MRQSQFIIDKQTATDLNLFGKYRKGSVVSLFMQTATRNAERKLEEMFQQPLTEAEAINKREAQFDFFKREVRIDFPLEGSRFDIVEQYFAEGGGSNVANLFFNLCRVRFSSLLSGQKGYMQLTDSALTSVEFLKTVRSYVTSLAQIRGSSICDAVGEAQKIVDNPRIVRLTRTVVKQRIRFFGMVKLETLLRHTLYAECCQLVDLVAQLDLLDTVARVARERNLCRATAEQGCNRLDIGAVRHPCILKAVANDISIDGQKNLFFLTGANMAGKSTLMKSIGTAVYMAHVGFPVAAQSMHFDPFDGLFSSINVSDNINMGYSHFYAEVKRVKEIAIKVADGYRLLVMFDELFKGTNVKDAFEATTEVTEAFAAYHSCKFVISTHITEAGRVLGDRLQNIQFHYVPTVMEGNIPRYTYILRDGITDDRHGMIIVRNERIVEIIRGE